MQKERSAGVYLPAQRPSNRLRAYDDRRDDVYPAVDKTLVGKRTRKGKPTFAEHARDAHPAEPDKGLLRIVEHKRLVWSTISEHLCVLGQIAAEIRAVRPPEPYKGKGIRYADERVIIKETKKK